ncbi:diheme cytochrome c-553 [Ferruginibacter lapsinanis]|uniref:c-type cytochrome n=1 Tax=Ferruginibacter lapsinanis TaxID=563172 RepID=UPI001E43841C|nr:diheme cytochrome c-553 [Ferruginibacter lapsinanis]UEG49537.1 diheme cytochrome c-553 [Ferruginibacter lapsinanis]
MQLLKSTAFMLSVVVIAAMLMTRCSNNKSTAPETTLQQTSSFGGFETKEKWGEHLVTVGGCNDCHTPKKITAMGPVIDSSLWLSGHPEHMPIPEIDRKLVESKGLAVTNAMTSWVGPWGVSFAANLTSDSTTGIGAWTLENFITAIRKGKKSGTPGGRPLLPPMPWEWFKHMSDAELDAIFTYLQYTKPIHNVVPPPLPPLSAKH